MKAIIRYILSSENTIFSFKELFLVSGELDANLFRRKIYYYVKKGDLYHIRRGLYAKDERYDRYELATKIFTPSYVSLETVLAKEGVIFQYYDSIFVVTYHTKEIECDDQLYLFRKIKDEILTNPAGIENTGSYFIATKERAFLDMLYLNTEYHFDNLSVIDFAVVEELLPMYGNKIKMGEKVSEYKRIIAQEKKL